MGGGWRGGRDRGGEGVKGGGERGGRRIVLVYHGERERRGRGGELGGNKLETTKMGERLCRTPSRPIHIFILWQTLGAFFERNDPFRVGSAPIFRRFALKQQGDKPGTTGAPPCVNRDLVEVRAPLYHSPAGGKASSCRQIPRVPARALKPMGRSSCEQLHLTDSVLYSFRDSAQRQQCGAGMNDHGWES